MHRPLLIAALLIASPGFAQSTPDQRPMPSYQDNDAQWKGGSSESYGTADLHHHVDQTPPPPPVPQGYGAYDAPPDEGGWQTPPSDEGDRGGPSDTAHVADRARTAELNRRPRQGYNQAPGRSGSYAAEHARYQAELARHARDMKQYRDEQSRYSQRMAGWQSDTDACEHGDTPACTAPR